MKSTVQIACIFFIIFASSCNNISEKRDDNNLFLNTTPHKSVILDVDMCTDVDDVCAVRIATALDDNGTINLKDFPTPIKSKSA